MRLLWMGFVVACCGITGCGPDIRGMCEAEIACEGGNDLDIDACVATAEVEEDYIDEIGCGAEYDEYMTCVESYRKCDSEPTGQPCSTSSECNGGTCSNGECVWSNYSIDPDGLDACEVERRAYNRCT